MQSKTNLTLFHTFFKILKKLPTPFILLGLILPLAGGCKPDHKQASINQATSKLFSTKQSSRISVFLNLRKLSGPNIQVVFNAIELVSDDKVLPLIAEPMEIEAYRVGKMQKFISSRTVPSGNYKSLRFTIDKARLKDEENTKDLSFEKAVIDISLSESISLKKEESKCIFIEWDLANSLTTNDTLSPKFYINPQPTVLIANLAYVACPEIDTVYYIRTDKNYVMGSIGVKGRPTYLAANEALNRLFVLSSKESAIKVFDLDTNKQIDVIQIPLTRNPSFMAIGPDGLSAYILEEQTNNVVLVDLAARSLASRVRLGQRPSYLLFLSDHDRVAVSSSLSQRVFLVDPETLSTVDSIQVGNGPHGLLVDGDLLYVAESTSNTVTVYNLLTRRVINRINAGFTPRRFLIDSNRIYLANYGDNTISILLPGQSIVSKTITLGNTKPLEMASSQTHNWLYIGDEHQNGLTVIDPTSNRIVGQVELGAKPLGITIIE